MAKKLTPEAQIFIVQSLACYVPTTDIIADVREEFSIDITRFTVRDYNPERNPEIAAKWKELFDRTRAEFEEKVSEIPISKRVFRVEQLQRMYERTPPRNVVMRTKLLEQAAKEVGGRYTESRTFRFEKAMMARQSLALLMGVSMEEIPMPDEKLDK